ncbi:MAG: hypothetical protein JW974_00080 [Alphaproteobacteria bacterium]|nr:hypothetical protein [Alphaproteobacteria bacterium]MBN2675087.1 hypothetical protein [Alphaproteobacteria bacterium]
MHKLFKSFGLSLVGIGSVFILGAACAAETGRATYNNVNSANRATFVSGQQRMPTMAIIPGTTTGNLVVNTGTTPAVVPLCPDGSVMNSDYKVENCMDDVLSCVNNGALPGGLNDLFNEDLRNSIFNGMNLCAVQVDKCLKDVRINCRNVYSTSSDFWIDFNSRKIQPEYFSFVLRKTGLTPNQAENTCWLLDKNTYGSSFDAISNDGSVTSEYNNKIGAYNNQSGGNLIKNSPQGVAVNNNNIGVDGQRGHYARWDAAAGECLVRVAAYNKDSQIKNSWLFGTLGNDEPAEVWKAAGKSFSCNKDLFGFSLLKNTNTVAVVGVGGGTVVGAGVGALAGHGKRSFDCNNKDHLKELTKELRATGKVAVLNEYMDNTYSISSSGVDVDSEQCESIVELYDTYQQAKVADKSCSEKTVANTSSNETRITFTQSNFHAIPNEVNGFDYSQYFVEGNETAIAMPVQLTTEQITTLKNGGSVEVVVPGNSSTEIASSSNCTKFRSLNLAKRDGRGVYCTGTSANCIEKEDFVKEVRRLGGVLEPVTILQGEKSNMLAATAIGAGVGAASGGLATAITAFVEKNNINCRVGDGLQKVDFGKSYSIGSLKDFYVKWNLRLPDTIMPTATATDCASWTNACATLKDLNQCAAAQINYKPVNSTNTTLVSTACVVSGSTCTVNHPVAVSNGACQ